MGRNPSNPGGLKGKLMPEPPAPKKPRVVAQPAPVIFEKPPYVKRSSLSPEQGDTDADCGFYDRALHMEDMPSEVSTSRATKKWGNGSSDAWGRPVSTGNDDGGGGKVSAGQHTEAPPPKRPSRPGRW